MISWVFSKSVQPRLNAKPWVRGTVVNSYSSSLSSPVTLTLNPSESPTVRLEGTLLRVTIGAACPVGPVASLTVTLTSWMTLPLSASTSRTCPSPTEQASSVTHVGAMTAGVAPADPASHDSPSNTKRSLYSIFTSRSKGTTWNPTTWVVCPTSTNPGTTTSFPVGSGSLSGVPGASCANVPPTKVVSMTTAAARTAPIMP